MKQAARRTLKFFLFGATAELVLWGLHWGLSLQLRDTPIAAAMITSPGSAAAAMGGTLVVVRLCLLIFVPMWTAFMMAFAIVAPSRQ